MDDEEHPTADQARQTPWIKRNKAERHAIYEQREARRKATFKNRMDRIDQRSQERADETPPRLASVPSSAPGPARRRWYQRRPWKWIVFWGGLTSDDGVYIPGTGPGDRSTGP